jgi:large subunit ribosomal protein L13
MNTKTYQPKAGDIKRNWHLIDAKDAILGRLSTEIAVILMGKNKPEYSQHMDNGDEVVVINAGTIKVTGKKAEQKTYYSHSGFPGGFKKISYEKMKETHPERILILAVKRMLPQNRLRDDRLARLHISLNENNPWKEKING